MNQHLDSLLRFWKPPAAKAKSDSPRREEESLDALPFTVTKSADGTYRWVLISSNSYEDRDGEIVSQKALEADVERADGDGQYGPLLWWHEPGLVLGECDGNAMHGRMLVEWGRFKNAAIGQAMASSAKGLRVSIGFNHPASQPDAEGVFHNVRRFERSLLPLGIQSNSLTAVPLVTKETTMLKSKIDALKAVFGGDDSLVNAVLAAAESHEKAAAEAGTRTKAKKDDEDEKVPAESEPNGTTEDSAKPFPKKVAEDDEDPKKSKAVMVGDLTVQQLDEHILDTLKNWGDRFQAALQQEVATTKEANATAVKAVAASVEEIKTSLKATQDQVAELDGSKPRVLGERWGWQPSRDGAEASKQFTPPHSDDPINNDPNDPFAGTGIDKAFKALTRAGQTG